jgi:hypothetical protein
MKTALIFLVIAVVILILLWLSVDVWLGNSTVDIRFHDTYLAIHPWYLALIVSILFLGTFFFIGGAIGTKLQNRFFVAFLLLFVAADAYAVWRAYSLFNHL